MAVVTQAPDRITTDYTTWKDENPDTYNLFRTFCREVSARRSHYSADALGHRVRWHVLIEWNGEYKVNNNYIALIARDLMDEGVVPQGFFETRARRSVA